jgi:hypothetical protein
MKKTIYILWVFLTVALAYSCSEEQIGQTPTDGVAPGQVRNPVVESIPGGAKITYELPTDEDLLYVQAVWTVNGVEKNATASLHNRTLEIKGFGTTDPQTVKLYSVDRSGNRSAPLSVNITPGTPPVDLIVESIHTHSDWGGFLITWENIAKEDVSIVVTVTDSVGNKKEVDVIYSNSAQESYNVRNLPPVEQEFSIQVRDRWDNFSNVKKVTLIPLDEIKLDKKKFERRTLVGDFTGNGNASYPWAQMFDDITTGNNFWYGVGTYNPTPSDPKFFTIDLGVTAKLSRYTLWHRGNNTYEYAAQNPKYWRVYGTNTISTSTSLDYWRATEDGLGWMGDWTLIADCESFKPSGMLTGSPVTQEDREYCAKGFSFDIPMEIPAFRYIRFYVSEIWSVYQAINIGEITFWGQVIE